MQSQTTIATDQSDDIEIDLRKYIAIIARHWRLLLTCLVISALLGGLLALSIPRPYEASASIAIVRNSTSVELTESIKTISQDEVLAAQAQTNDTRRNTLVGLVHNSDIAARVIERVQQTPGFFDNPDDAKLANVMRKVQSELYARGDLILIKVRDNDPAKAALIANTWADEYQRYVNRLYVGAPKSLATSVESRYLKAQDEYQLAQKALEAFIATSQEEDLKRQVEEKKRILDSLQQGLQSAVTLVISEQLRVNTNIIAAYLNAQSANRLIAFEKEQEGRRDLVRVLLDAQNAGNVESVRGQLRTNLELLDMLLVARIRTRQYLLDARSMRIAVEAGGDSAARSNATALNVLKTQAFALNTPISGTVELRIEQVPVEATLTAAAQLGDIDGLIKALEARDTTLTQQIDALSTQLQSGQAYSFELPSSNPSTLNVAISDTYGLLFDVGNIGQLSEGVSISNPLTLAAKRRADEIFSSEVAGASVASDSANLRSNAVFEKLQNELRLAQSQLESQEAQRNRLTKDRDLKRETADTLARKLTEVSLSADIAGTEVVLAGSAFEPTQRAVSALLFVGVAVAIGLLAGVILAFVHQHILDNGGSYGRGRQNAFGQATRWVFNE
jgi:uncharacterized protein involved in exopolysaccharide biosynthesis